MSLVKHKHYIDNQYQNPADNQWFETVDPYTTQPWALIARGGADDVDCAVEAAHRAVTKGEWAAMHSSERGRLLRKVAEVIRGRIDELADIEVTDNGKLINEIRGQLAYLPSHFDYYAGMADKIEGQTIPVDKPDVFCYTQYQPLGVIAAIVPWNSPLLITTWKIAPALAAGNTVVIKPSEFTSVSALKLAECFELAGFPPGVVNVVTGYGHEIGDTLVSHPKVAKVSFTGGTETGKHIGQVAAGGIKKVSLELGGKSPNIVFGDCDINSAVNGVVSGIFAASGQTCIAGSRLLVQQSIHDEFVDKLVALAKTAIMGNPKSTETQVGPITTPAQFEKVGGYFEIAKQEGAQCVLGGKVADMESGWFVEPSVYTSVHNQMRLAQEEIFGPVLSVIPFDEPEQAIEIANDIPYGLAAGVWTEDYRLAMNAASQLQAGNVWINTYRMFSYMTPFGGHKASGIGHECGQSAIYQYLSQKSVWLNLASSQSNPFVMK